MFHKLVDTANDRTITIIRLIFGIVFFAHGAQKALGLFGGPGFSSTLGFFQQIGIPAWLAVFAIAAEFLGGLGLLVGFLTRIAAQGSTSCAILWCHLPGVPHSGKLVSLCVVAAISGRFFRRSDSGNADASAPLGHCYSLTRVSLPLVKR